MLNPHPVQMDLYFSQIHFAFFFFKKNTKTKQKEKHFGGSCLHLCKIFLIFYPTAPFALPFASREFPAPSLI